MGWPAQCSRPMLMSREVLTPVFALVDLFAPAYGV